MVDADLLENVARWREEIDGRPFGIVKQECQHNPPNNVPLLNNKNLSPMVFNAVPIKLPNEK